MNDLHKLTTGSGRLSALAIDQRGALRRMLGEGSTQKELEDFKILVAEHLTPYASSILLDPELGLPASQKRVGGCGLLMAYEKTGYDTSMPGRLPDLLDYESVKRLKEKGADAVKLLIYVDIDEVDSINDRKKALVERVGAECLAEALPFFLEILTYDDGVSDRKAYAKLKPHKVIEAMKAYADPRYNVAVLKVETPVDMTFVEGFGQDVVYTREEAAAWYRAQAEATPLPYIFLSAGVSAQMFRDTLRFAKDSGSSFNGVLCGRATWAGGAEIYKQSGLQAAKDWFQTIGRNHIQELANLVEELATPIEG